MLWVVMLDLVDTHCCGWLLCFMLWVFMLDLVDTNYYDELLAMLDQVYFCTVMW